MEKLLTPGAEMFSNRLKKNLKLRKKWASKTNITSYRLYDADMPEYAVAIDYYEQTWVHIQEYAPPEGKLDPEKVEQHRKEIMSAIPDVLPARQGNIFFKTRKKQKGKSQYTVLKDETEKLIIHEGGLSFFVNFSRYLDPGIFLDHRITRDKLRALAKGKRFLNLFCYTGTATVYAAAGGAVHTCSVDTNRTFLAWAEENLKINNLAGKEHEFVQEDVKTFLKRNGAALSPAKSESGQKKWDLIFLDPPTFSNSKSRVEIFDVQKDHVEIINLCLLLLSPGGELVFSNNYHRFKLNRNEINASFVEDITERTIPEDFARKKSHKCWLIKK